MKLLPALYPNKKRKLARYLFVALFCGGIFFAACDRQPVDPSKMKHELGVRMFRYIKWTNYNKHIDRTYFADGREPLLEQLRKEDPLVQFSIQDEDFKPLDKKAIFLVNAKKTVRQMGEINGMLQKIAYRVEVEWAMVNNLWVVVREQKRTQ